jgi:hypothetical protein
MLGLPHPIMAQKESEFVRVKECGSAGFRHGLQPDDMPAVAKQAAAPRCRWRHAQSVGGNWRGLCRAFSTSAVAPAVFTLVTAKHLLIVRRRSGFAEGLQPHLYCCCYPCSPHLGI